MINEVFRAQSGSSFAITETVLMLSIIRHYRITVRLAGRLVGPCAVDIRSESHSSTGIGALCVIAVMKVSLFLTVLLLLAASSVAQDIHYNFDVDTHFENFKTYKWVEIKDAQKVDELKEKEIKSVLDVKLTKKHLTKTDAETADLYIGYEAGVDAEKQFASYDTNWDYGSGWDRKSWYGGFYGRTKGPISTIYRGQLAVDMYDPKNHCLVWRGVVSKALDTTETPEKQRESLRKAVNKLLTKYPPPPLDSLSY
jgi:hypothetical protein